MSRAPQAIFLSYACDDAGAARRFAPIKLEPLISIDASLIKRGERILGAIRPPSLARISEKLVPISGSKWLGEKCIQADGGDWNRKIGEVGKSWLESFPRFPAFLFKPNQSFHGSTQREQRDFLHLSAAAADSCKSRDQIQPRMNRRGGAAPGRRDQT
jgi:hypothetical protein